MLGAREGQGVGLVLKPEAYVDADEVAVAGQLRGGGIVSVLCDYVGEAELITDAGKEAGGEAEVVFGADAECAGDSPSAKGLHKGVVYAFGQVCVPVVDQDLEDASELYVQAGV